jgi:hypothetical protein
MLEEMGKAGPAPLLVLRADVVPDVHGHDGGLVVLVNDHSEAVVENELLERDLYVVDDTCRRAGLLGGPGQRYGEGRGSEHVGYSTLGSHLRLSRVQN